MKKDIADLFANNAEIGLDAFIEAESLRDIPVLGNLLSLWRIKNTISDRIFFAKLKSFIVNQGPVDPKQLQQWNCWIAENKEEAKRLAETVILILDNQRNLDKCAVVGHLFARLVAAEVDNSTFCRISDAISAVYIDDLYVYCRDGGDISPPEDSSLCQRMLGTGFFKITGNQPYSARLSLVEYELTDLGLKFFRLMENFEWNKTSITQHK